MDELPPDQRAALSLLLRQHKSYAEVAALLGIAERAVHDRAHAAIAVLAPRQAREVAPERRLEIGDYLLGQQPGVAERLRTRTYLGSSAPARAWAGEIAAALAPLAGGEMPEIPGAGAPEPERVHDLSATTKVSAVSAAHASSEPAERPVASASGGRSLPSSRVGGAVLLAVIVAAAIVVVVLISGGSSGSNKATTSATHTGTSKSGPTVDNQITMRPTSPKIGSIAVVDILSEGSKRAFFIEAQHLPASKGFYYAIWLYNSPSSALALSKSPPVGSTHRLAGGSLLPSTAGNYREILLTEETAAHPRRPGHVVLRAPFSLTR
jgi:Sigma-70, region 4